MNHSVIAAGVAAIALAFASPAAAGSAHHAAKRAPAAERCAVPTRAEALAAPLSDRALQAKIDQLTGVIATLSDRLASLEEKLDSSADKDDPDADDESADDEMSLASAHRTGRTGVHRPGPAADHRGVAAPVLPAA